MKRTPLKRGNKPLKRKTPLRARSRTNSRPPAESKYLNWIRSLECVVCGGANGARSEAAHTRVLGHGGIAAKSPDRSAIPLCIWCHRLEGDSYHSLTPETAWAEYHGLAVRQLVYELNERFDALKGKGNRRKDRQIRKPLKQTCRGFNEAADSDISLSETPGIAA